MNLVIVGTSFISQWFVNAVHAVGEEVYGVCSRNAEKGQAFADSHRISKVFTTLDDALADPQVELVYIASPNSVHFGQAKQALTAGRHVICEKPLFSSLAEFREIRALAQEKQLFFFEAITTYYLPNFALAKAALPELGPVHLASINYSQYSSRFDRLRAGEMTNVFDPAMGGGSLPDLGIYCIHMAVGLFGRPGAITARRSFGYGAQLSDAVILTYPEMICTLSSSKACGGPSGTVVRGERGWLEVTGPPGVCDKVILHVGDETRQLSNDSHVVETRMQYEVEAFLRMIRENDRTGMEAALDRSEIAMEILDQATG